MLTVSVVYLLTAPPNAWIGADNIPLTYFQGRRLREPSQGYFHALTSQTAVHFTSVRAAGVCDGTAPAVTSVWLACSSPQWRDHKAACLRRIIRRPPPPPLSLPAPSPSLISRPPSPASGLPGPACLQREFRVCRFLMRALCFRFRWVLPFSFSVLGTCACRAPVDSSAVRCGQ